MKILQAVSLFYPALAFGGPARVSYSISKELAKRGHEITVFTTDAYDRETRLKVESSYVTIDSLRIEYFKNMIYDPRINLFIAPELVRVAKREIRQFDVVHLHDYRSFLCLITTYYAKKCGVPYVLQAHGQLPRIMAKRRLKWIYDVLFGYRLLRDASKVIALNRVEAQQYRDIGVPEEKIEVIPNGIDLSEYADLPPKGDFKKKSNIDEDEKIVLYLGRIHKIKGIDILTKAFADVIEKLDNVKLAIVGPDDGYLSRLEALIRALKIEDKVLISGPLYCRDKLEAYVDANVYVLPSRYEVWGMTVLEAYACSKPVIASRTGGLNNLVLDGTTGLLVEAGNATHLANSVCYLLNNDDRAEKMGLSGRNFVEDNFTIERAVSKYEKLCSEIIRV